MAAGVRGADPDRPRLLEHPEYAQLLNSLQTQLNLGYVGRKTPQEALDDAAIAQQAIYDSSPDKPANAATPAPS